MNKIEEQLVMAYATMIMGGAMAEDEVPETLVLIEGAEPSTLRALAKIEVARRVIEELNKPEPEPTVSEETIARMDAVEMALAGLMEMMLISEMPIIPEDPEEPEIPVEEDPIDEEGGEE